MDCQNYNDILYVKTKNGGYILQQKKKIKFNVCLDLKEKEIFFKHFNNLSNILKKVKQKNNQFKYIYSKNIYRSDLEI